VKLAKREKRANCLNTIKSYLMVILLLISLVNSISYSIIDYNKMINLAIINRFMLISSHVFFSVLSMNFLCMSFVTIFGFVFQLLFNLPETSTHDNYFDIYCCLGVAAPIVIFLSCFLGCFVTGMLLNFVNF
jgi:hypothetical protein